ncbi:MAG: HlyD family type I secretion periplasmic adaptor subunit [Desulfamplus sp.]|nr:HlyD family type I secretion periplasmic adaptor subunit [Desulfamplus sp.]
MSDLAISDNPEKSIRNEKNDKNDKLIKSESEESIKILHTPIRTHFFLVMTMLMVVCFVIWSAYGELDVVSMAVGEVVPSSRVKTVQHLEGGIIREILVREGEQIKADQSLVILESTGSTADVAEQSIHLKSLEITIMRLTAEINGSKVLKIPEDLKGVEPQLTRNALAMFQTRQQRVENQIRVQQELINQYKFQIEEIQARLSGSTSMRSFVEEQVGISQKLLQHNLSNRMNHLDLLKQLADLKGQQRIDQASLKKISASIKEAESRLALVRNTFIEEAQNELREVQRTAQIIYERLNKNQDSLRRTVLRSPVDGTVKSLFFVTIGGIVPPGGAVAEIVPSDDRLIIEARLPIGDIGYVHAGQQVNIRLASSDGARLGHINGKVIHVSPDSTVIKDSPPFYKIKISPEQDYFGPSDKPYRLFPGMMMQCSVITDQRTVLEYLLPPFVLSFETSMHER